MRYRFIIWMIFFAAPCSVTHAEGLKIVANTSQAFTLSREQVRNLYMGASLGRDLKPVALSPNNRLRSLFNTRVIGLAESRIQSYWAQMKFTGRQKPPKEFADERELTAYLQNHPGTVAYLPESFPLSPELKVIFEIR